MRSRLVSHWMSYVTFIASFLICPKSVLRPAPISSENSLDSKPPRN